MSLINRMLLELDARQGVHNTTDENITSNLPPVPQHGVSHKRIKIYTLTVACLALITAGIIYLPLFNPEATNPATTLAAKTTTPLPEQIPNNTPTTSANTTTIVNEPDKAVKPLNNIARPTEKSTVNETAQPDAHTPASVLIPEPGPSQVKRAEKNIIVEKNVVPAKKMIRPASATPALSTVTPKTSIAKKRITPKKTPQNQFATAMHYYQQGRMAECLQLLNETLSLDPKHQKAREILSNILMQQQRWLEAEQILVTGMELNPADNSFKRLLARLKIEQGQEEMAIAILEKPLYKKHLDAESSALLALLYQRQGLHPRATLHYKHALSTQPTQGKWWLGLAISQEAQQQWSTAAKSYRLAATSNGLESQLKEYARQRQQVMSQQQTAVPTN